MYSTQHWLWPRGKSSVAMMLLMLQKDVSRKVKIVTVRMHVILLHRIQTLHHMGCYHIRILNETSLTNV